MTHRRKAAWQDEILTKACQTPTDRKQAEVLSARSPTNQYETFELDYLPWFNVRFILQYNVYQVVNNNQNPFFLNKWPNPKASDNNTFVLGLWMDF